MIEDLIQQAEAALIFHNEQVALYYKDGGGDHAFKHVSVAALKRAFAEQSVDSGWLSPNVMRWGIDTTGEWWIRLTPAGRHILELANGDRFVTPLPAMVMFAHGGNYRVLAIKDEFSPTAALYHAPLPNCYSDGSVCWGGSNTKPEMLLANADEAWRLFISSPFNGDLADRKSHRHNNNVVLMLSDVAESGATLYPLDDLIPLGVGSMVMVNDFLAQMRRGA